METKNEALELARELEESARSYRAGEGGPHINVLISSVTILRSQAAEIERLESELELARMKTYAASISDIASERDQLKAKNEKLVEASTFALELLDFIRKGCESGAVKSKPFITPDPEAKSLELMTIHGECVKAIKALKENT